VLLIAWLGNFDLRAMWQAYRGVAESRGNPFTAKAFQDLQKYEKQVCYFFTICLFVPFAARAWAARGARAKPGPAPLDARPLLLCLACMLTGLVLVQTNMELKFVDLSVLMVPAFLLAFPAGGETADRSTGSDGRLIQTARFLALSTVLLITIGSLAWGWQRVRVFAIGKRTFFESSTVHTQHGPLLFRSVAMSPRLKAVLRQLTSLLEEHPDAKVMFGPRMTFAYAAYNKPSPLGLPIAWDAGTMYPAGMEAEICARWKQQRFELLVFLVNDFTYLPAAIVDEIHRHYRLVQVPMRDELTVFVVRPD
jgi:hypothetical protein